jgi:hypothetical protein
MARPSPSEAALSAVVSFSRLTTGVTPSARTSRLDRKFKVRRNLYFFSQQSDSGVNLSEHVAKQPQDKRQEKGGVAAR